MRRSILKFFGFVLLFSLISIDYAEASTLNDDKMAKKFIKRLSKKIDLTSVQVESITEMAENYESVASLTGDARKAELKKFGKEVFQTILTEDQKAALITSRKEKKNE